MSSKFIVPLKLLELNAVPALTTSDWHNLYYRQGYLKNYKSSEKDVVLDRPLDGFTPTVCLPIVATDTVLQAFEKLQCQITNLPPQVNADWLATSGVAEILNKPVLATVATTGDYNDLLNIPVIPPQVNADWNALSGPAFIFNKPTITPQVNADWLALSGPAFILNKPTISPQVIAVSGSTLYSTNPVAGPNFSTSNSVIFGNSAGTNSGSNSFNVQFIGQSAGQNASSAYYSTFIGLNAGRNATNGRGSVYIGPFAGVDHPNAFEAVFIGNGAGGAGGFYGASYGCLKSLFVGPQCGEGAKDVIDSCAIGSSAMRGAVNNNQCISLSVSSFEVSSNNTRVTGIGSYSTRLISGNTDCVGIGFNAFSASNNSNNVIGIGYQAAYNNDNVDNVIALGYNAGINNTKSGQFIVSTASLPKYLDSADAAANLAGGTSGNRYFWIDASTLDANGSYTVKVYIP